MSGRDSNVVTSPVTSLLRPNAGSVMPSTQFEALADVAEFCDIHSIRDDVVTTLALARQHFAVLGCPR